MLEYMKLLTTKHFIQWLLYSLKTLLIVHKILHKGLRQLFEKGRNYNRF